MDLVTFIISCTQTSKLKTLQTHWSLSHILSSISILKKRGICFSQLVLFKKKGHYTNQRQTRTQLGWDVLPTGPDSLTSRWRMSIFNIHLTLQKWRIYEMNKVAINILLAIFLEQNVFNSCSWYTCKTVVCRLTQSKDIWTWLTIYYNSISEVIRFLIG